MFSIMSTFAVLPAELIVETSDYLDGCQLYRAFYGLNRRLDRILNEQCHRLHVDLHGLSKREYDICTQAFLPNIVDRLVSLVVGGAHSSTPGQLRLFFSIFGKVLPRVHSLNLIDGNQSDLDVVLPFLPSLRSLKCPRLIDDARLDLSFPSSLEQLDVSSSIHIDLLRRCPSLKRLTMGLNGVDSMFDFVHSLEWFNVTLTSEVRFDEFSRLLTRLSSLRSLAIEGKTLQVDFLDARRWEETLPKTLRSFRFDLMIIQEDDHPEARLLLEAFKRPFWISRRWFVRCHLRDQGRYTRLSTVHSPTIRTLFWPDDELLLDPTTTIVYPRVTDLHLWWNVARSAQVECPRLQSVHLYGATENPEEPIHPEIVELLRIPSLRHLLVEENLPLGQQRFGGLLSQCSSNVDRLTCSTDWLRPILVGKDFERICLLLTLRIRRLTLTGDGFDLVAFARTFVNLEELTMKLPSMDQLRFLLNALRRLTKVEVEFPPGIVDRIDNETTLDGFLVQKSTNSRLTLWIGSRRTSSFNVYF